MRTGRPSATAASSCSPSTTSWSPWRRRTAPGCGPYQGISEAAGLLGGGAAAVAEHGDCRLLLGASCSRCAPKPAACCGTKACGVQRSDAFSTLVDIRGRPVIDRELVIAVSIAACSPASICGAAAAPGNRDIGMQPEPMGRRRFRLHHRQQQRGHLPDREDGRIRWIRSLPKWEDEVDKKTRSTGPSGSGRRPADRGGHHRGALSCRPIPATSSAPSTFPPALIWRRSWPAARSHPRGRRHARRAALRPRAMAFHRGDRRPAERRQVDAVQPADRPAPGAGGRYARRHPRPAGFGEARWAISTSPWSTPPGSRTQREGRSRRACRQQTELAIVEADWRCW